MRVLKVLDLTIDSIWCGINSVFVENIADFFCSVDSCV